MVISNTVLMYSAVGLGLVLVVFLVWHILTALRIKKMFAGTDAKNLEKTLESVGKELQELRQFTKDMETYLTSVERRLKQSVQGVETIRFNPFKGTGSGGNQSFSTSLVNEHGDGVVLTSMYARERISMFAKPIKAFKSEFDLSEEETEALNKCKQKITTKQ